MDPCNKQTVTTMLRWRFHDKDEEHEFALVFDHGEQTISTAEPSSKDRIKVTMKDGGDICLIAGVKVAANRYEQVFADSGKGEVQLFAGTWNRVGDYFLSLRLDRSFPKAPRPSLWLRLFGKRCASCASYDEAAAREWFEEPTHQFANNVNRYGHKDSTRLLFQRAGKGVPKKFGACMETKTLVAATRIRCDKWKAKG